MSERDIGVLKDKGVIWTECGWQRFRLPRTSRPKAIRPQPWHRIFSRARADHRGCRRGVPQVRSTLPFVRFRRHHSRTRETGNSCCGQSARRHGPD